MDPRIRLPRALFAGALAAMALAPAAQAGPDAPDVPTDIQVTAGNKPYLVRHAEGVQIYGCNGSAWSLIAPRANLYDDQRTVRGTHFGGPTWQDQDGSQVKATREAGVTVDPTAIPWLKLKKASTAVGDDGDRLTNTSYIQRINTTAGLPPAAGTCTAASAGAIEEIPYTADYVFWKKTD